MKGSDGAGSLEGTETRGECAVDEEGVLKRITQRQQV